MLLFRPWVQSVRVKRPLVNPANTVSTSFSLVRLIIDQNEADLNDLKILREAFEVIERAYDERFLPPNLRSKPHARDIIIDSLSELRKIFVENIGSAGKSSINTPEAKTLIQLCSGLLLYRPEAEVQRQKDPTKRDVPLILPMPPGLSLRF